MEDHDGFPIPCIEIPIEDALRVERLFTAGASDAAIEELRNLFREAMEREEITCRA